MVAHPVLKAREWLSRPTACERPWAQEDCTFFGVGAPQAYTACNGFYSRPQSTIGTAQNDMFRSMPRTGPIGS